MVVLDISSFDTSSWNNTQNMFYLCSSLMKVYAPGDFKYVSNSLNMFSGCKKLVGCEGTTIEYIASFDNSNSLNGTYAHIDHFTTGAPGYFSDINLKNNGPKVLKKNDDTNTLYFVYDNIDYSESSEYTLLTPNGFSDFYGREEAFDTSVVTAYIDENFKAFKPKTTSYWFGRCNNLKAVYGSKNIDTSDVTAMQGMFLNCANLKAIDIASWRTDKVTNIQWLFYNCGSLTDVVLSNFSTDSVVNMLGTFYGCSALTSLDLSRWDTSLVTNMQYLFYNCKNLEKVYVSEDFETSQNPGSPDMFNSCNKLTGENGTTLNAVKDTDPSDYLTCKYACIDTADKPGYFTYKAVNTLTLNFNDDSNKKQTVNALTE